MSYITANLGFIITLLLTSAHISLVHRLYKYVFFVLNRIDNTLKVAYLVIKINIHHIH